MKNSLLMKFSVDKENKKVFVEREFAAGLAHVWAAWTQPELLDLWWAPKPYKTQTKTMDFREGGRWLYAMVGPDGTTHWCRTHYQSVDPRKSFSGRDSFCDENGNVGEEFPGSLWKVAFSEKGNHTLVNITIEYKTLEDLEKVIEMGFKEGFTMAMENLDEVLEGK